MNYKLLLSLLLIFNSPLFSFADVNWQPWSDSVFEQAKKDKKLVILDLEAVWCHWCHVMDKETYSNPEVQKILNEKYIALKVDQDSRPDLSNRYEDYGWPATIIFDQNGKELVKESGFIDPKAMIKLLTELSSNPQPRVKEAAKQVFPSSPVLSEDVKQKIILRHYESMDEKLGGLNVRNKFLFPGTIEYSISQSIRKNERDEKFARLTLDNNLKLFDPAWGGVYQYSTHSDWDHAHFEKIMYTQTSNIKAYSHAYSVWKEPKYLEAALSIYKYVRRFLTDNTGAFYTSQDADLIKGKHSEEYFLLPDAERIKLGIPKVDQNIYSRENGQMIEALVSLYSVSKDQDILDAGIKAADWIEGNRKNTDGAFRHGSKEDQSLYLGDTLYMGRAFLALYVATANRKYLLKAEDSLRVIQEYFLDKIDPGAFTTKPNTKLPFNPVKNGDENIALARFSNLVYRYTGGQDFKSLSESAMRFIASPEVALDYVTNAEVLIAAEEIASDPMHITVVGSKKDQVARDLYDAGLSVSSRYKRIEWWDRSEGPLPNSDVTYPELPKSAAFLCTNKQCSLPIFKPEDLTRKIAEFQKRG